MRKPGFKHPLEGKQQPSAADPFKNLDIQKSAVLSPCHKYRFELRRVWNQPKGLVNFIGLNPSTADASEDDPTIRRCIRYAYDWGYGGLIMTNLFAWRLTDSTQLKYVQSPVGLGNLEYIEFAAKQASVVVAAWGKHKMARIQGQNVRTVLRVDHAIEVKCLRLTDDGQPWHPLYLPADLRPIDWSVP